MKKLTLLAIAAFAVVSMSSCKKDRTCTCTSTNTSSTVEYTVVVTKVTKADAAKGVCSTHTTNTPLSGGGSSVSYIACTVK